jgi:hypothetical protein
MDNIKHVIYWGNYMYFGNKLQNILFKNSFLRKTENEFKNINNPFIPLAPMSVFAP